MEKFSTEKTKKKRVPQLLCKKVGAAKCCCRKSGTNLRREEV
jgi:hypothetical protein